MSGEMAVSLALKLNDQGSGPASQALQKITRAMKETGEAAKTASTAAMSAFKKLADSREILGIRSEKAIQNEIKQTEAAYKRMAESGQVGAREMGRAQDAMRQKVAGLRKELGGVKSSAGGAGSALSKAAAIAGAFQVGKMVLQGPISQTMNYGRELAHASNVMFAGQSLNDRRAGMQTIQAAVKDSVQYGGTPESALAAYQMLAGSGEFKAADVATALPQIVRAATANGGSADEFSKIALAARRNLGLTDFNRVANMATTAGQLGGFEIKDMAKGLPEQLAAAKNAGLTGYSGYASLLALNQASVTTAGTTDQASNNVVNLLNKINSRDTANDFKRQGIDLDGSLLKAQENGTNTLEAFGNLVDHLIGKDKRYAQLKEKAKTATGDEQKQIYSNMAQIAEGAGIGKVLQDRQALMGFLAYRNQHDKYGQNGSSTNSILNTGDSVSDNMALITETPAFKAERLAAERMLSMQDALDKVNPLLGNMAEGLTGLMRDFPVLSAALSGTALGVETLGSMALTASGALALLGGAGAGGAATAAATAIGILGTAAATLSGLLAAAGAGYAAGTLLYKGMEDNKAGDFVGAWVTQVMALAGSKDAQDSLGMRERYRQQQEAEGKPDQPYEPKETNGASAATQIIKLVLDGRVISETINQLNARYAARN